VRFSARPPSLFVGYDAFAMAARGALILDVTAAALPAVRAQLSTIARPTRLKRASFVLHDDGRATYDAPTVGLELARVAQSVGVATCISVATSLALNWMFYLALPAGFAVGLGWAAFTMSIDRRRLHAEARHLLRAAATSAAAAKSS
jgi:hypothetical protein